MTTPVASGPSSPSSPATLLPPAGVTSGAQWDLMFDDEFNDPAVTASKWSTGMRTGAQTLESNGELEWYQPANSVVTTDNDGFGQIGVLRQTLQQQTVPSEHYTVRTLSRIYPPSKCAVVLRPEREQLDVGVEHEPHRGSVPLHVRHAEQLEELRLQVRLRRGPREDAEGLRALAPLWLRDWRGWNYEIDAFEGFDRSARVLRTSYWWGDGSSHSTENDGGDIGIAADGSPCRQDVPVPPTSSSPSSCSLADGIDLSAGYHTIGLNWTPRSTSSTSTGSSGGRHRPGRTSRSTTAI